MAREIGLFGVSAPDDLDIAGVVPVRVTACSEQSSVSKRLPEPLLFRI